MVYGGQGGHCGGLGQLGQTPGKIQGIIDFQILNGFGFWPDFEKFDQET
jgi:hypothetical protein